MKKLGLAIIALTTLLFASAATAGSLQAHASARSSAVLKVCPDASGCFTSIQAAIDAATDGDMIKIAAGTYQGLSLELCQATVSAPKRLAVTP
jgi:pectin methylesterase-like acyl-CoA thioesterase